MPNNTFRNLQSLLNAYTQDTRLIRLATPLGRSMLLAECVRGEEGIDQGFKFQVSALSPNANISLKSLVGQPALLQLLTAINRDLPRPFHGYITGIELAGSNAGLARYHLTLEPWLKFLSLGRDSRIFQDVTVFDILDTVFSAWRGKGRLAPAWRFDIIDREIYAKRSLTTQYQESDFAFAARLMNEEGLFHYFEHTADPDCPTLGSHMMVIADHNGSFKPNAQASVAFTQSSAAMKQDSLDRWRTEFREQANTVEISSWDYRTRSSRPVQSSQTANGNQRSPLTVRETMGAYAYPTREQGQRLADNMMQALTARREIHVAAGTVRTLAPGTSFTVLGHAQHDTGSDDDRTFIVLRTIHLMHNNLSADIKAEVSRHLAPGALAATIDGEGSCSLHAVGKNIGERPLYRVRIDCIRSSVPYRSSHFDERGGLLFPRPTITGQQTAIVVGPVGSVIHTDRDHRIKIQFHWQRGAQSHSRLAHCSPDGHTGAAADDSAGTWVRLAAAMAPVAGANWGSCAVPRVGQEILVDFLEGNIDRPVGIACLYNGRGAKDAQHNDVCTGAGAATGNAPAWFPGESGAHAHPASLSGFKTQAMAMSQHGNGAYNLLAFDDSPGRARMALQRHAAAHRGTDELNLGQLRHQTDNAMLAPSGYGAELKTAHSAALRAARGMLLSSNARNGCTGSQLDSGEAYAQIYSSAQLQAKMATTAQKHNAKLRDNNQKAEAAPEQLPAIVALASSAKAIDASANGTDANSTGGGGEAPAYSEPQMQVSGRDGIAALTPANAFFSAGTTSSVTAGQDVNLVAQGNSFHAVTGGIGLFTYGKAISAYKPNQETGINLHAATGNVSSQSQSDETRITADKAITFASVTKAVKIAARKHVMLTAQGAFLKLEGGNIMIHGPGTIAFKASMKELSGPKSATQALTLPPLGTLAQCPAKLDAAGACGASAI
jgi:type VI secretion system secreted protein VgrG